MLHCLTSFFCRHHTRLTLQRGLTLIESLIGSVVGSVILSAVLVMVAKGYGASSPDGSYEMSRLAVYNTAVDARAAMAYDSQAVTLIAASGQKTNPDLTVTSSDGTTLTVSINGMSVAASEPIRQNAPPPNSFVVATGSTSGGGPTASPTPFGGGGGSGPSGTLTPSGGGGTGPSATPTPSGGKGTGGGGGGGGGKPTN